ncbi:hypothetical protein P8452_02138 [Trifolium repens]|nr:hypothetical protein P8452_02138 [Trifolium repens]
MPLVTSREYHNYQLNDKLRMQILYEFNLIVIAHSLIRRLHVVVSGYILRGRKDAFQDALAGPLRCELKARAMNTQMGGGRSLNRKNQVLKGLRLERGKG